VREIEIGIRPGAGVAPRAGVNTDRPHERAELELTFCMMLASLMFVIARLMYGPGTWVTPFETWVAVSLNSILHVDACDLVGSEEDAELTIGVREA